MPEKLLIPLFILRINRTYEHGGLQHKWFISVAKRVKYFLNVSFCVFDRITLIHEFGFYDQHSNYRR